VVLIFHEQAAAEATLAVVIKAAALGARLVIVLNPALPEEVSAILSKEVCSKFRSGW
jgi:hypothetical protein